MYLVSKFYLPQQHLLYHKISVFENTRLVDYHIQIWSFVAYFFKFKMLNMMIVLNNTVISMVWFSYFLCSTYRTRIKVQFEVWRLSVGGPPVRTVPTVHTVFLCLRSQNNESTVRWKWYEYIIIIAIINHHFQHYHTPSASANCIASGIIFSTSPTTSYLH